MDLLQPIFDDITLALAVVDPDGRLARVNRALGALCGAPAGGVRGTGPPAPRPPAARQPALALLVQLATEYPNSAPPSALFRVWHGSNAVSIKRARSLGAE